MEESFKGRGIRQSYDWKMVGLYLILVIIGLVNIYAAIHSADSGSFFSLSDNSGKQCLWILTAIVLAASILFIIPARLWEGGSTILYIGILVLLIAVIFIGGDTKGSHSWFKFGAISFQPAELSKVTTSLLLASVMSKPNFKLSAPKDFLSAAAVIGIPMLVIIAENETGSALVYCGYLFVLYREGMTGWIIFAAALFITLFILTLTRSPFVAIWMLTLVTTLCNSIENGQLKRWILVGLPLLVAAALMPKGLSLLNEYLVPGASFVLSGAADPFVEDAILSSSKWSFLLKIKPLHILLGATIPAIPFLLVKAYKQKRTFLALCIAFFIAGIILVFSSELVFDKVLKPYQRARVEVLLGIREDPAGFGYNVRQAMIAIGSGGLTGKGFLQGTQTTFGFVPEQSTDFIFCTIGEEWGFLGCTAVILLYGLLIFFIVKNAERSREAFTRIYGYCVASCLFMHLFINIGMTIGLMPVIGIPLPLISYGGSSLWAFTILIFIFVVLDHEEKKYF